MNPLYDFEDIDDYLNDRMSESDRQAFELALQNDEDLVRRVEALRAENKVLRMLRDEHLLEQFDEWETEIDEKKTVGGYSEVDSEFRVTSRNWRRWIIPAAAATVVGLALAGYFLGWFDPEAPQMAQQDPPPAEQPIDTAKAPQQTPVSPVPTPPDSPKPDQEAIRRAQYAALGNEFYQDKDFKGTLMGDGGDEPESAYTRAVKSYEAKDYAKALTLLEKPDPAQMQQFNYLRAYTLFHLKRYAEAELAFREFRNVRRSVYKFDAQWGEVFCLLKQLPAPAARKRLDGILLEMTTTEHPYHDQAMKVQQKLAKM